MPHQALLASVVAAALVTLCSCAAPQQAAQIAESPAPRVEEAPAGEVTTPAEVVSEPEEPDPAYALAERMKSGPDWLRMPESIPGGATLYDTRFARMLQHPSLSPDGSKLAFVGAHGKTDRGVWFADLDPVTGQITGPPTRALPRSPDFRYHAVVWSLTDEVPVPAIHSLKSRESSVWIGDRPEPLVGANAPAWDPTSSRLAFVSSDREGRGYGVFVWSDGEVHKLSGVIGTHLRWSPDGTRLVVSSMRGGPVVIELATREETELKAAAGATGAVTFSPDGESVAYYREVSPEPERLEGVRLKAGELWTLGLEENAVPRQLGDGLVQRFAQGPVWLPDGSGVVGAVIESLTAPLAVFPLDGSAGQILETGTNDHFNLTLHVINDEWRLVYAGRPTGDRRVSWSWIWGYTIPQ